MGNLFCCRRGYELFKARYAKERIEPIDVDAFNNFDFNPQIYGVQQYSAGEWAVSYPEYNEEPRDYVRARIRRALAMNDLSSLPEELQDVTKLSDLVLLYGDGALPNATEQYHERQRKITNKTRGHRRRKYLQQMLVNVKAAKYGLEDYEDRVKREIEEAEADAGPSEQALAVRR